MRARNPRFTRDYTSGKWSVSFEIDRPEDLPEGELELTIKPYKPKRSRSANAYMWTLVGKISDMVQISPNELYRKAVRELGISQLLVVKKTAAAAIDRVWSAYGLGWFTDRLDDDTGDEVILRLYYGSSSYNKQQMAALIDLVVQDCKQLGIETLTPAELAGLVDRWETTDGKVQKCAEHNARR